MKIKSISTVLLISIILSLMNISTISAAVITDISVGDYIQMGTYYGEPILWRCVDKDENGLLMLSDKIICTKPFDAKGNNTSGSHGRGYKYNEIRGYYRQRYGSNYWGDSNIRCWLNSYALEGQIKWLCGNPPTEAKYANEKGFLSNFSLTERLAMKNVNQKQLLSGYEYSDVQKSNYHKYGGKITNVLQNYDTAYSEDVLDKVFLLDVKQLNNIYSNKSILGDKYYVGTPTQACLVNDGNSNNSYHYWLRDPLTIYDNGHSLRCVRSNGTIENGGGIYDYAGYEKLGVRPAFYLADNITFLFGNGSVENPYRSAENVGKTAKYRSDLLKCNKDLQFEYSDKYFIDNDGYTYNHDLAKATLALELSSWTARGADDKSANDRMSNISSLYDQLGFKNVAPYNYDDSLNDNSDKVAYSFATKELYDGSTIVAAVVRGGGYGAEWRSNLHVGSGSKHAGFSIPAQEVYNNLDIYLSANNLDRENTKIWITGYSRGAAVANIVAGRINETGLIKSNNLYAYTFATPNGVKVAETGADSSVHDNIYNIVLPYDFVPKVAMENWGYGRYGQTLMVKNSDTTPAGYTMDEHMPHERYFLNYTSKRYSVDKSQTKASNHLRNALSAFGKSQNNYVSEYEGLLMDIIEWAMYRKGAKGEDLTKFVFDRYGGNENFSNALAHAYPYMSDYSNFSELFKSGFNVDYIYPLVILMYMNGIEMSENETIDFIVNKLSGILKEINVSDIGNASGCFEAHNPEYYIAWLYAYDNPKNIYESSTYKKLTIACPVNVNVYDSAGTLVASVVDNKVVVDTLTVEVIGESAEIYFYEGDDIDDYTIEIEAYDEGEVNYSVTEYENSGVETRKINYANIPVSTGTKLSGNVPKGQSLDAEVYNLTSITNEEETTIEFAEDLTGEDLQSLTVDVTVEGDGVANDIYFATKGDLVVLEATPYHDATFLGWYDANDELISSNQQYSFILSENMNVVAKFTKCTAVIFTSAPKISGNDLSVNTTVSSAKDIDGQYIIAIYSDNNVLLDTKIIPASLIGNTEKEVNETFNASLLKSTPAYAKLFLWSNFDDLIPLCSSTKANVQ